MGSYYTFFLMRKFGVSIQSGAAASLPFPLRHRRRNFSRRTDRRPDRAQSGHLGFDSRRGAVRARAALRESFLDGVLAAIIGLILSSAFSAILVYAQELVPGKVGMMSGLFFGLAFGMGGIGSAILGALADRHGIPFVFKSARIFH